jgi:predicted AlkP superfamily phosphohydrolase/phosphomutase
VAKRKPRVLVIGLDCGEPNLVFDQWLDELPAIKRLVGGGLWGRLQSSVPCITVPAWMSMMTSKDPGQLGFYGFRNRGDFSYKDLSFATSLMVKEPTVWDILGKAGKRSTIIGVPPAYPPRPLNGSLISCFLTPSTQNEFTYPGSLKAEVQALVGDYMFDVKDFRTADKNHLLRQVYEMSSRRHKVVMHLLKKQDWDLFMYVEMGTDRMHHGFWRFMDPLHVKFQPDSPYAGAIKAYYQHVDRQMAEVLTQVDDETTVLVVSDHGAKRMDGGFCLNEWLWQQGYLALSAPPQGVTPFEKCAVDWGRTVAWGAGGYYGRLFLNVKGREPQGTVAAQDFEKVRSEIAARLEAMPDHTGTPMGTKCLVPQDVYRQVRNIPPDLICYFGNLYWRSVGSMGHGSPYTFSNDTGPDDANHAEHGMVIVCDPRARQSRQVTGRQLMDVAPTILAAFGLPVPADMCGRVIA